MDGVESGVPVSRLERARLEILNLKLDEADDLWRAVDAALRVSASTLRVARVGVWIVTADRASLYRARLHDTRAPDLPTDDAVLPLATWPHYRDAVIARRIVAANDARTDAQTAELGPSYLEPLGITSMLDVPMSLTVRVHGIVCHEHIGPARTWTRPEIDFAVSVGDMLAALLEQGVRLSAERDLRASEAHDARSRQIAVVARTAAGIAHDVNTVLQAISANAVAAGSATTPEQRTEAIQAILEDCQRSARILGQLRELDAPHARLGDTLGLVDVVDTLRPTLEALVGATRSLDITVEDRVFVAASRTDIERIVLNLVANARDASEDGAITIAIRAHDGRAVLEVDDQGPGLDAAQADHVFEPYFTTKDAGHGGLGLFIVQVIAERSGGAVSVTNAPGRGARFIVSWPNHA